MEEAAGRGHSMHCVQEGVGGGLPCTTGFLSMAGNQSHGVHTKETKVQLALSLQQLFVAHRRFAEAAASAPSAESAPPAASASWEQVVQEMMVMKPHFQNCLKEAAEFAAAWASTRRRLMARA